MDVSSANWLSEWGVMEDPVSTYCEWPMNPNPLMGEDHHNFDFDFHAFSSAEGYSVDPDLERPTKQLKPHSTDSSNNNNSPFLITGNNTRSSTPYTISFGNSSNSPPAPSDGSSRQNLYGNLDCVSTKPKAEPTTSTVRGSGSGVILFGDAPKSSAAKAASGSGRKAGELTRTPLHAQDHVMAERKRREKLSQRFIALSAIVPGLKKTDKASVLGDAIDYMKQLQDQVRTLEEQTKKRKVESAVFVKKSQLSFDDDNSSSVVDESSDGGNYDQALPGIEAKVSEKDVLIRVHCERQKGLIANLVTQVENFGLTVLNTNALSFGDYATDITVIAKMDDGFCMTVKDLVSNVRQAILKFM